MQSPILHRRRKQSGKVEEELQCGHIGKDDRVAQDPPLTTHKSIFRVQEEDKRSVSVTKQFGKGRAPPIAVPLALVSCAGCSDKLSGLCEISFWKTSSSSDWHQVPASSLFWHEISEGIPIPWGPLSQQSAS